VILLLLALAAGSIGGFLDSMAGSGFGAMAASTLAIGGVSASTAVVSVNIAKIASGLSGSIAHARLGNVRMRLVTPLAGGGIAGALIGGAVAARLPETGMRVVMHIALLAAAGLIAYLYWRRRAETLAAPIEGAALEMPAERSERSRLRSLAARHRRLIAWTAIGAAAGLANTMAGAFGPVVMAGLLLARGGHPRHIVGSVTVAEIIVAAAGIASLAAVFGEASISLKIAAPLAIGGILAAPAGALFARRAAPRRAALLIAALLVALNSLALATLAFG
jgi:hypothetical protein